MSNLKAMSIAIDKAASGYAENIARDSGRLSRIQCPAIDYGIRMLACDLVNNGLVDADKMYEFLDERRYRDNTPDMWWLD
jgi:hypothetical protein